MAESAPKAIGRQGEGVAPDRVGPLAALAEEVRRLTEAAVFTDVDAAEAAAVTAELAGLADRLNTLRRPEPPLLQMEGHGLVRQLGSPVTGLLNPIAPPVDFEYLPDRSVRCEYTLGEVYEGPPGYVHGGISALILDHLLGAAALANGTPGMTATLELRYRRPTPLNARLVATAKAVRTEGRKAYVDATITGPDGRVTIEATGMFILPLHLAEPASA